MQATGWPQSRIASASGSIAKAELDEESTSRSIDPHHVRRLSMMTHAGVCSARSAASLPGLDTTRARAMRMRVVSAP